MGRVLWHVAGPRASRDGQAEAGKPARPSGRSGDRPCWPARRRSAAVAPGQRPPRRLARGTRPDGAFLRCFLVRLGAVSSSRPDVPRAPSAAAVKDGPPLRGPPRPCAARSVLDGGEHGARLGQVGRPAPGGVTAARTNLLPQPGRMFYICSHTHDPPPPPRPCYQPRRLAGRPHRRSGRSRGPGPHARRRPARAAARSRRPVPRRCRHAGSAAEAGPEAGRAAIRSHRQLLRPVGGPAAGTHGAAALLALAAAAGAAGRRRAGAAGRTAARSRRWRSCWRPIPGWGRSCARSAGCSGWIARCCPPRGGGGGR